MTEQPNQLISIDFTRTFPHKFWISTWAQDESYPDGFRYKILSVRHADRNTIELVVVLEEPEGEKTEMKRLELHPGTFDRAADAFLEMLGEEYRLRFDCLDLSRTLTAEEFSLRVAEAGWQETSPS